MPLPVAHALVGASVVAAIDPSPSSARAWKPLLAGAALALCPDLDYFFEWVLHWPDVHRTFTHSLVFALGVGGVLVLWMGPARRREGLAYSLAFLSHTLLDFATTRITEGVAWLWPYSMKGFKLGWFSFFEFEHGFERAGLLLENLTALLQLSLLELVLFLPVFLLVLAVSRKRRAAEAQPVAV